MKILDSAIRALPTPFRDAVFRHRELIKFGVVGGTTFIIDNALYFSLVWTVMAPKPTIAKVLAVLVATIVSYVLNSSWSFSQRGGRRRTHEAALFFAVSGIGIVINATPLYISRHYLNLDPEHLSNAWVVFWDFVFGGIIGMLLAMVFRWWAFRRFVFPEQLSDQPSRFDPSSPQSASAVEDQTDKAASSGPDTKKFPKPQ